MGNAKGLCAIDLAARQIQAGQLRGLGFSYREIATILAEEWGPLSVDQAAADVEAFHRARTIDVYNQDSINQVLDTQDAAVAYAFRELQKAQPSMIPAMLHALGRLNRDRAQMRGLISNGGNPRAQARDQQTFGAFMQELRNMAGKIGLAATFGPGTPVDAETSDSDVEVEYPEIDNEGNPVAAEPTRALTAPAHLATDAALNAPRPEDSNPDAAPLERLATRGKRVRAATASRRGIPVPKLRDKATARRIARGPQSWTDKGAKPLPTRETPRVIPVDDEATAEAMREDRRKRSAREEARDRARRPELKRKEAESMPPDQRQSMARYLPAPAADAGTSPTSE